jgi:hypothetical protein
MRSCKCPIECAKGFNVSEFILNQNRQKIYVILAIVRTKLMLGCDSWQLAQQSHTIMGLLIYFPYLKKWKEAYEIILLCVCLRILSLLGKGSVNTFPRRRIQGSNRTVERGIFYAVGVVSNTQYVVKEVQGSHSGGHEKFHFLGFDDV